MVSAELEGKVALVTGASGGIGLATAAVFARAGAHLALVDKALGSERNAEQGTVERIGCDLSDGKAVSMAFERTLDRFGRVDILVNIAGIMIFKPLEEQSEQDWHQLLAINLIAPALLSGLVLRHGAPGSSIINIASVHARRTSPLVASYAASKAALVSLTRSTAIEGRERGIRCNAILPGAIDTPLLQQSPAIRSGEESLDPADIGQPDDIAQLALYLASPRACFITGEDIVADHGRMGRL
ncbi:SDR family oxidoreductase [Erythrobacter sp. 3-20A1M]|uniref:SDR family NAD(P)-dependent oxidoreductase n=1 Tax=Erythrobacter sp. 3-20A1M TaxID=2653850 RepID=UPI001BFBF852|nr:SDR family oxidoreductase [Erythrobacter sp. 3-20A1M]QWC57681.1 SDR family oxidoreductase [Erythrobacter sp. 3-20A1M]